MTPYDISVFYDEDGNPTIVDETYGIPSSWTENDL